MRSLGIPNRFFHMTLWGQGWYTGKKHVPSMSPSKHCMTDWAGCYCLVSSDRGCRGRQGTGPPGMKGKATTPTTTIVTLLVSNESHAVSVHQRLLKHCFGYNQHTKSGAGLHKRTKQLSGEACFCGSSDPPLSQDLRWRQPQLGKGWQLQSVKLILLSNVSLIYLFPLTFNKLAARSARFTWMMNSFSIHELWLLAV